MNVSTIANNSGFGRRSFLYILVTVLLLTAGQASRAQENVAKSILKAMSDYVGSQQTIGLTFDSDIEVITPQLEKIQYSNSGKALLSRPDKLHAHRVSGHADVELFYNGRTVSIYGKSINGYTPVSYTHLRAHET